MARVRRVFAGVSGSPGSLQAVRYAADLARTLGCELIPVLAWSPPGGDLADRGGPSAYLRQVWKDAAWQRLEYSLELAFGQVPADLRVEPLAVRGDPGAVLVTVANKPDDLIAIGAGRRGAGSMSDASSKNSVADRVWPRRASTSPNAIGTAVKTTA